MNADVLKREFVDKYLSYGEIKFYRFLLFCALNKLIAIKNLSFKGESPNLEFLTLYNNSLILYRREGDDVYLQLARLFRKAGHRIYRIMLKKGMTNQDNRFLNIVKCK